MQCWRFLGPVGSEVPAAPDDDRARLPQPLGHDGPGLPALAKSGGRAAPAEHLHIKNPSLVALVKTGELHHRAS